MSELSFKDYDGRLAITTREYNNEEREVVSFKGFKKIGKMLGLRDSRKKDKGEPKKKKPKSTKLDELISVDVHSRQRA